MWGVIYMSGEAPASWGLPGSASPRLRPLTSRVSRSTTLGMGLGVGGKGMLMG